MFSLISVSRMKQLGKLNLH